MLFENGTTKLGNMQIKLHEILNTFPIWFAVPEISYSMFGGHTPETDELID